MNTKIKLVTKMLSLGMILSGMTSCNADDIFEKEQYKNVVYVLSNTDFTFPVVHSLDTPTSTGYFSVYAGGTLHIDHDISVTLEKDPTLIEKYNHSNFDLDESKYAKELPAERYTIANYTAVLKAKSQDSYATIPVVINTEGLSPDSTYLIPLRVVDDGSFELNKNKSQVLYRVYIKNEFTSQAKLTTLFMRGNQQTEGDAGKPKQISANKNIYPLSKRTIRINAGLENSANKVDLELINKSSLILEITEESLKDAANNPYNPVLLKPYKDELIEVEQTATTAIDGTQLTVKESNRYTTESDEVIRYYLSYKYRTLKKAATGDIPAEWNKWIYVYESLKVPTE